MPTSRHAPLSATRFIRYENCCRGCGYPPIATRSAFSLKDSESFDDWQFFHTENLRQNLAHALELITRCYIDNVDYRNADLCVREWLFLDRMNEAAYRCLM